MDNMENTSAAESFSDSGTVVRGSINTLALAANFRYYGNPTVVIIGIIGNVLAIIVFYGKNLKDTVTTFFFRSLALADMAALIAYGIPQLLSVADYPGLFTTDIQCKAKCYFIFAFRSYAAWILVFVTLERCIGVNFPHLAKVIVTRGRAKVATAVAGLSLFAMYSFLLVSTTAVTVRDEDGNFVRQTCIIRGNPKTRWFAVNVWTWLDFIVSSVIPFCVMLLGNCSIILRIIFASIERRKSTTATQSNITGPTLMLISVSFGFLLLTLPFCAYFVSGYSARIPWVFLWATIAQLCLAANHSVNFFLYCVSGATFRQQLKLIFCSKWISRTT